MLEKQMISVADPCRGRFRTFLLTALRNFLANEWQKGKAEKRGGTHTLLSLDVRMGEARYIGEAIDKLTPERLYQRCWAETLLDRVSARLRDDFTRAGKELHFEHLRTFLAGSNSSVSYAEAARRLNMSVGAAMVAVHRMRQRFRDLLYAEIGQTVADPQLIKDEIRSLFAALERP